MIVKGNTPGALRNQELNGGMPAGWRENKPRVLEVERSQTDSRPTLYAIISTWHDADIIEATVKNCFAQGCSQVFILDNDSPDNTRDVAVAAGATIDKVYTTEKYDEDLRIRLQNEIIHGVTEAANLPDLWWLVLDADEFPSTRTGRPIIEELTGLPASIRTVGCDFIDLYPLANEEYVPGVHPAKCLSHGVWRKSGPRVYCHCGHWKHAVVRYLDGNYDVALTRGNHTLAQHPGRRSDLIEPNFDFVFFHAPMRRKADAHARLKALCDSGRSQWDDQVTNSNGAIRRWQSLEDIYSQNWAEVMIPHSQVFGRKVKGICPLPWRSLLPDYEGPINA